MSENWIIQYSLKDGQPLLNVRSDSVTGFFETLAEVAKGHEELALATRILAGDRKPEPARPAAPHPQAPAPVPAARKPAPAPSEDAGVHEVGPIKVEKVDKKKGPKVKDASGNYVDGKPWKSPMYIVTFTDGTSASTFEELDGKAAMGFAINDTPCYATLEPSAKDPRYTNLLSIRMASAAPAGE